MGGGHKTHTEECNLHIVPVSDHAIIAARCTSFLNFLATVVPPESHSKQERQHDNSKCKATFPGHAATSVHYSENAGSVLAIS